MLGGCDVVFPAVGDSATLVACARIILRQWPHARIENAVTGTKYARLDEVPFVDVRELLVYSSPDAEALWDADSPDSPINSILYLIGRPDDVTVVLDDRDAREMVSILEAIRGVLWTNIQINHASAA